MSSRVRTTWSMHTRVRSSAALLPLVTVASWT